MERSNRLLYKKFLQYLLPTMITMAAVSLNEFVDSLLVSNLLGDRAFAIVNLGMPVMLAMSAISQLLGSGGATAYALATGNRDHETAGKSFTCSFFFALVAGLILLLCIVITGPLASVMCTDLVLLADFEKYLTILLISGPFIVVTVTITSFLPSAGYPKFSMAVNVIANVVNIAMDYVYIRVFGMGVEGAAFATLTGYICAAAVMIFALVTRRVKLDFCRKVFQSLKMWRTVFLYGISDALNQIGLSLQIAFLNGFAMEAAGTAGVVAYSLCIQSNSIMSIFVGSVIGSSVPLLAVLHGQRDYRGESGILKASLIGTLVISAVGTVVFFVFARQMAVLYNITEPLALAASVTALRIYSLFYIPRNTVIVYYRYLKVIGLTVYASILSILDSVALVVPMAWVLSLLIGTNGLWIAYPVSAVLLVIVTLVVNLRYAKESGGKLKAPLLIEQDDEIKPVLDVTISQDSADISAISGKLQEICLEQGMDERDAVMASLAVEEIAVNAAAREKQSSYSDVLVRINHGCVEIDFRTLGKSYDPLETDDERLNENVLVLQKIATSIEHEYILGMNSTRITLGEREDLADQPA